MLFLGNLGPQLPDPNFGLLYSPREGRGRSGALRDLPTELLHHGLWHVLLGGRVKEVLIRLDEPVEVDRHARPCWQLILIA